MIVDKRSDLKKIQALESKMRPEIEKTGYALSFHLMPPTGWLNDPNGLCQCDGIYHIFFQYSPYEAQGGDKYWGHYETKDFLHFTYTGVFLSPDNLLDKDGVYSGSALAEDGTIYLYYTGNVKEDGDFDYTYDGRGSNTILVTTKDGITASSKTCLLTSQDYPETLSCHVRDPKVFAENGSYYMVLGGRTRADEGIVMLYRSSDKENWDFVRFISSETPFGYMWECPDLFLLGGHRFLSLSPQGVPSEALKYQNIYQSGYYELTDFRLEEKNSNSAHLSAFHEWDMGFDFYAPQTFLDERGRRILIGWLGIPDADYTNPTVSQGWQHALTIPRELVPAGDGSRLLQRPIEELRQLRGRRLSAACSKKPVSLHAEGAFELLIQALSGQSFEISIDRSMRLSYEKETGIFALSFLSDSECSPRDARGYGRKTRRALIENPQGVTDLQIFTDHSCIEIFVNGGAYVFTSRYYKQEQSKAHEILTSQAMELTLYELRGYEYRFKNDTIAIQK